VVESRDDLTQLLSRGEFDSALEQGILEARQSEEPLSLVLGDIDHFKNVNDTNGHQTGDAVLREVASRLVTVAHGKGHVYRYGGEEITIILKNHSANEALAVAERCRRRVESESVAGVAVSMSFGVASMPEHAADGRNLLAAADRALYDAKNRGRNLVRLSGEPDPTHPGPRETERKAPEAGKLTDQQKADFRKRVLRHQPIECPNDGAFFDVRDVTTHGSVGRDFMIMCPECGLRDHLQSGQRVV
jgi:diguanylate cyclase (GGDEF)-like protein